MDGDGHKHAIDYSYYMYILSNLSLDPVFISFVSF